MSKIIPSGEIAYRVDLPLLCNAREINCFVEVGVSAGVFAKQFLSRWNGGQYILVDSYDQNNEHEGDRAWDKMTCALALAEFHGRVFSWLKPSLEAAKTLPKHFKVQGVYIDAAHDELNVRLDLEAWSQLLLSRDAHPYPLLAGHDFDDTHPGVKKAVTKFAEKHGLIIRITKEHPNTWYTYLKEPPILYRRYFDEAEFRNPEFK